MAQFRIEGGHPLSGTILASGNKNAALPALAASLMSEGPVLLHRVPKIGDVLTMIDLLAALGASLTWVEDHTLKISAASLAKANLREDLCRKVRGSVLLAAPLLHRFGEVELPFPGGDRIGRRRLDTHLMALEALGARVQVGTTIRISAPKGLVGADILLDEASVTATENTIMAAALATGKTIIRNAASEPHVQDLCHFLNAMGGDIEGIGTNQLTIHGVRMLRSAEITLGADYIEVGSLIALCAVVGGEITIQRASPPSLRTILHHFRRLGIDVEIRGEDVMVPRSQRRVIQPDYRGAIPKIEDAPWPGFPADLTSVATVAATQCEGCIIIHEKMFESRMFFVDQLIEMGARIVLCDPHRAVVIGRNPLHGARMTSPDIRAGMALLIASLCAEGESRIGNIIQIDRGYERIDERLRALGARIEREP